MLGMVVGTEAGKIREKDITYIILFVLQKRQQRSRKRTQVSQRYLSGNVQDMIYAHSRRIYWEPLR